MELRITDIIQEQEREEIFQGLLTYNLARIEDKCPKDLGIYYEQDGQILAGLIGKTTLFYQDDISIDSRNWEYRGRHL